MEQQQDGHMGEEKNLGIDRSVFADFKTDPSKESC